jgi:transcriptional regulator
MSGDKRLTESQVEQIFTLKAKGFKVITIARMLEIDHTSVLYRLRTGSRRVVSMQQYFQQKLVNKLEKEERSLEVLNPGKASYADYLESSKLIVRKRRTTAY